MIFGRGRSGTRWAFGPAGGTNITGFHLEGVEDVARNMNKALERMKGKSTLGLLSAANFILTDADIGRSPLVPHRTGKLRASRFAEPFKTAVGDPFVVYGYGANYAAAVHEMLTSPSGLPIDWTRPGSGPKFFEASIKRNSGKVLGIVAKHSSL